MKTWIYNNLDKVAHVSISIIITIILSSIFLNFFSLWVSIICGITGTLLVGILKEVYDKICGGIFDYKDFLADLTGAILGGLITFLIL